MIILAVSIGLFTVLSNAELSGGEAVRLSAGLERGGAVKDEDEKNLAPDASAVFQTLTRLMYLNRLPLNSARERALPDVAEKTTATGDTARKELTPLEGTFEQAKLNCTGKK